jgi:hypothetical protein
MQLMLRPSCGWVSHIHSLIHSTPSGFAGVPAVLTIPISGPLYPCLERRILLLIDTHTRARFCIRCNARGVNA